MALAYFLTWTTYGTWLPGDKRGWVDHSRTHGEVVDGPNRILQRGARSLMPEAEVTLDADQRAVVEAALRDCLHKQSWHEHAISARSNHVHAVVTAYDVPPGKVMGILKASATKCLNTTFTPRKRWWTHEGSKRILFTEEALGNAIRYVLGQGRSWTKNLQG
jgi:REP element-mobilizing transposase RayT